ncbi:MAG TPA: hypothetical protein VK705_11995 [Ferruginibacter sp.]|jgi:hypothetical protein|nr:hypothetical protein [Ferruginibacter sp.]
MNIADKKDKWDKREYNVSFGTCIITGLYLLATIGILYKTNEAIKEAHNNFATSNEALMQGNRIGISNWDSSFIKWDSTCTKGYSIITFNIYNISPRPINVKWAMFGVRYGITDTKEFFKSGDSILIDTNSLGYVVPALSSYDLSPSFSPNYSPQFDYKIINTHKTADCMFKGINTFMGVVCYTNYINDSNKYYVFSVNVDSTNIEYVEVRNRNGWHVISKKFVMEDVDKLNQKYFDSISCKAKKLLCRLEQR